MSISGISSNSYSSIATSQTQGSKPPVAVPKSNDHDADDGGGGSVKAAVPAPTSSSYTINKLA